jgi:hypothetical protein
VDEVFRDAVAAALHRRRRFGGSFCLSAKIVVRRGGRREVGPKQRSTTSESVLPFMTICTMGQNLLLLASNDINKP